jgi:hypothetical protein
MELTKHAKLRQDERGIPNSLLDVILENGIPTDAPGGAIKIFFGKREHQKTVSALKKVIQMLDKAKGGTLIVKDDNILTVYKSSH